MSRQLAARLLEPQLSLYSTHCSPANAMFSIGIREPLQDPAVDSPCSRLASSSSMSCHAPPVNDSSTRRAITRQRSHGKSVRRRWSQLAEIHTLLVTLKIKSDMGSKHLDMGAACILRCHKTWSPNSAEGLLLIPSLTWQWSRL